MKVIYTNQALVFLMSSILKFSFFLSLLVLPISNLFSQCEDNSLEFGPYNIEFAGVEYDYPEVGQSTWYYTVSVGCGRKISKVTFPLNEDCVNVLDAGVWGESTDDLYSCGGRPRVGRDRKANVWGVKFREGIRPGRSRNYYFTLDQNLEVEPVNDLAIKIRRCVYKATICGPSPECNVPEVEEEEEEVVESCIKGRVWEDVNFNGIQEEGEAPIEGVVITLLSEFGTIGEMTTGEDGQYSFCGLALGEYIVSAQVLEPYRVTVPNIGDDELDSDIESPTGTRILTISFDGELIEHVDVGLVDMFLYDQQTLTQLDDNNYSQTKGVKGASKPLPSTSNAIELDLVTTPSFEKATIYPNPVVDVVNLSVKNSTSDIMVEVRTQNGQLVSSSMIAEGSSNTSMNLVKLPIGTYLVYFISDTDVEVEKLMKVR